MHAGRSSASVLHSLTTSVVMLYTLMTAVESRMPNASIQKRLARKPN